MMYNMPFSEPIILVYILGLPNRVTSSTESEELEFQACQDSTFALEEFVLH